MFEQEKMFANVTPNLAKISAAIFPYPRGSISFIFVTQVIYETAYLLYHKKLISLT